MNKIYPHIIGLSYVGLPIFVRLKKKLIVKTKFCDDKIKKNKQKN